jgi:hypothetical protein
MRDSQLAPIRGRKYLISNEKLGVVVGIIRRSAIVALAGVAIIPLVSSVATAAPSQSSKSSAATSVAFMSREQYLQEFGLPESAQLQTSKLPDNFRVQPNVTAFPAIPADPPGGGDAPWWTIVWPDQDLRGTGTPTRLGNGSLGYLHYAQPHNLYTRTPIHASFQTHSPAVSQGAHVEYIALAVNPNNGAIYLTVRVVVQAATRTDDGAYTTPDGQNIGVITAYCEGYTLCPDWVNSL